MGCYYLEPKTKTTRIPKSERISQDISLSGNYKQIQKAKTTLKPVFATLAAAKQEDIPKILSEAIDTYNLKISILYRGHPIWSRRQIIGNLDKIIEAKQLYKSKDKVRWIKTENEGYIPIIPKDFQPILSDYLYHFLVRICGTNPHVNKAGWIGIYPTVEHLKALFTKNEFGKPVLRYIPAWKTDAIRIASDMEVKLFPFRAYIRARQTRLGETDKDKETFFL
jgi:hypothetical protein